MSKDTACTVASAIVGSRLNYCNAILVGISKANLNKLQRVQNTLARVVMGSRRRDLASPRRSTLAINSCKDNIQNCDACVQNL